MYQTGIAYGHKDLLKKLHAAIQGAPIIGSVTYTGTGDGELTMLAPDVSATAETWTLTCTAAATDGGTFSVTGSVSGAQAAATVGTPYDNGLISFTITDGSADFAVNDEWQFDLTTNPLVAAGETWDIDLWDDASADHTLIAHGPGVSGTEAIYVGMQTYESAGNDYYNWRINTFTGYVSSNDFDNQPGRRSSNHACPLWQFSIPYHLLVNGNRITLLAKVETVYQSMHVGRFLPYGTPAQYPYPIGAWSMLTSDSATRYSDLANMMGIKRDGGSAIRFVDGAYLNPRNWPYYAFQHDESGGTLSLYDKNLRDTPTTTYPIIPVVLYDNTPNIYGEWDNIKFVTGFANSVENTVSIGADSYLVWRDHSRTGFYDYFAVKLD